jgi:hypothetical protein
VVGGFTHQGQPGNLASRIDRDAQRLKLAGVGPTIDESDHERHDPVHARTAAFEE